MYCPFVLKEHFKYNDGMITRCLGDLTLLSAFRQVNYLNYPSLSDLHRVKDVALSLPMYPRHDSIFSHVHTHISSNLRNINYDESASRFNQIPATIQNTHRHTHMRAPRTHRLCNGMTDSTGKGGIPLFPTFFHPPIPNIWREPGKSQRTLFPSLITASWQTISAHDCW